MKKHHFAFSALSILISLILASCGVEENVDSMGMKGISIDAFSGSISSISLVREKNKARYYSVPILMYHYVRALPAHEYTVGTALSVTPETFNRQLDILQKKGYHTISFAQLANTETVLPSKPVLLTFDDGYRDAYDQVFPELSARNMIGTFYVIAGFVGKSKYMTWEELSILSGSGMEIGAHTVHHPDLRQLSIDRQKSEILDSIDMIERQLQTKVYSFAYPAGHFTSDSMNIVKNSGVPFAVTTQTGIATALMNTLRFPRLRIYNTTDFERLF